MKSSIVLGFGFVGQATAWAFGIKDHFSRSDKTVEESELANFKYIFLCLPTPTVDGVCDTSAIEYYIELIAKEKKDNIFIMRSTVVPGTCERLKATYNINIVDVPEFLTEATWKDDINRPDLVVIGGDDIEIRDKIYGLLKGRWMSSEYIITDTKTSETIKYAINTLYALKVVFANQMYDYCKKEGINYENIKKALYGRKWIGKNHLDVHHKGYRGAGGKCLGKDLDAFTHVSKSMLLEEANRLNKVYLRDNENNETN